MESDNKKNGTLNRRDFLKALTAISGAAVISSGCTPEPLDKLVSYAVPPENVIPGLANYYSTAIPNSPAGSSIVVKVREGRAIKVEGNSLDPISEGASSAEDQATLQTLYDPDRIKQPLSKNNRNNLTAVTFVAASDILVNKINENPKNPYIITNNTTGSYDKLLDSFANKISAKRIKFETFSYESIRKANEISYGKALIPTYHIEDVDYLISFGADFLETWLSPTEYSKKFSKMHSLKGKKKSKFVQVEPKLTLTGSKADEWVPISPNKNLSLVLGIINYIKQNKLNRNSIPNIVDNLSYFSLAKTSELTGVAEDSISKIAKEFASSKSALAIGGGIASDGSDSRDTIVAINLLNEITGNSDKIDFDNFLSLSNCSDFKEMTDFIEKAKNGDVDLVIVHGANPAYNVPKTFGFSEAFEKIDFKVSFSNLDDETTKMCDLVIPDLHPFEKWGDYEGVNGNLMVIQPVMKPLYDGISSEEVLVGLFNRIQSNPDIEISQKSFYDYLQNSWKVLSGSESFETFWNKVVKDGGLFKNNSNYSSPKFIANKKIKFEIDSAEDRLNLYITPSYRFYDGRSSNNSWLQELPDLLTTAVWDSWIEINTKLANKLEIEEGDIVQVESDFGKIQTQAYLTSAMRPDTVSISLGQGHTAMGRYASNRGVNPLDLLSPVTSSDGSIDFTSAKVSISKTGKSEKFVKVQHSFSQENRDIAQTIALSALAGHNEDHHDDHHGGHKEYDMYREYDYFVHKWGMNIDLDKCTGCGACVVACYAENNIPVVGKEQVGNGRHMSWLKLERFQDEIKDELLDTVRVDTRIIPQLCQHCENAPCEPVCPVFATYHNPEGINMMVYSRCVGTRYCSNNCSYKVRRFNWFKYEWPEPLNLQLNPDVTVRSKGVMEKCNFCYHRIVEAKDLAKDEKRKLNDGEVLTACQQACSCDAIEFGDLNDPKSKVTKLSKDKRSYALLEELNTRPSVSYLKKIEWDKG